MSELKADQEPSIEEILESIRQIISEDGEGGAAPAAGAAASKPAVPPSAASAPAEKLKDKDVPLSLTPGKEAAVAASKLDLSVAPPAPAPKEPEKVLKSPAPAMKDKDVALSLTPDQEKPVAPSNLDLSAPKTAAAAAADADVLDLTEQVAGPDKGAPAIEMMDNPITDDKPMTADTTSTDTLISAQAAAAATESLSKLLSSNIAVERDDVSHVGKVTLEDITRELMKPVIKTWLDQNLPQIIEKIVQKEVEKLSRRALER